MKKINKIFVGAVSTAMVITSVGVSYSYAKNIGSYAIDNSILKNGNAIYTNRNIIDNNSMILNSIIRTFLNIIWFNPYIISNYNDFIILRCLKIKNLKI